MNAFFISFCVVSILFTTAVRSLRVLKKDMETCDSYLDEAKRKYAVFNGYPTIEDAGNLFMFVSLMNSEINALDKKIKKLRNVRA